VAKDNIPLEFKHWIEARKRYRLTDVQIHMARELGMNPKKFGSIANHKQEPWKQPLPEFIRTLYFKRFGKHKPDTVRSIEQVIEDRRRKKAEKHAKKLLKKQNVALEAVPDTVSASDNDFLNT
jgi:hypothetical protein